MVRASAAGEQPGLFGATPSMTAWYQCSRIDHSLVQRTPTNQTGAVTPDLKTSLTVGTAILVDLRRPSAALTMRVVPFVEISAVWID
jgi:hypothetical protein